MQYPPTEKGLQDFTQLVANYPQGFRICLGPAIPIIIFCHPDMIRTVANASGTHAELVMVGTMTHLWASSSSLPSFYVTPYQPHSTSPCLSQPSFSFLQIFTNTILAASSLLPKLSLPNPGVLGEGQP